MAEAMSDERLAEIRKECGPRSIFVSGVSGDGLCVMANELLAEVERLRKQLADVTAQRDEWHRQNGLLRGERDQAREELADLRATLRPEYGLRYPSNNTGEPDEQLGSASDEETARLLAAHGDTIMRRLRTDWEVVAGDGQ